MLATLQALYADVLVCVKTAEGLSSTFQSIIGVKQGCPLSPLLFGIFMDDFELHVQRTVSPVLDQLPLLCGSPVPPLLFADDMLLISTSAAAACFFLFFFSVCSPCFSFPFLCTLGS
jgi:hypothetical protein